MINAVSFTVLVKLRENSFHLFEFVLMFFYVLFFFFFGVVVLSYILLCHVSLSTSSRCPFSRLCDCLPLPDVFHLYPIIPASLGYTVCVLPALWQFVCSSVSRSHLPMLRFWLFASLFMVRAASFLIWHFAVWSGMLVCALFSSGVLSLKAFFSFNHLSSCVSCIWVLCRFKSWHYICSGKMGI